MYRTEVKYSGGPMNGKRSAIQNTSSSDERIVITAPDEPIRWTPDLDPYAPLKLKTGDYVRSNDSLKDGTPVYKWLGWRKARV